MEEIRSGTGGVKAFPIEGRMADERERLTNPMTDVERKMRAQWVKDQILAPHEPVYVPEIEKELLNPIRRFYRAPLDKLFKALEPTMGYQGAYLGRMMTGKILMGLFGVYTVIYYFKYNRNDWMRVKGWRVVDSRKALVKGDPGFDQQRYKMSPQEYDVSGFDQAFPKIKKIS